MKKFNLFSLVFLLFVLSFLSIDFEAKAESNLNLIVNLIEPSDQSMESYLINELSRDDEITVLDSEYITEIMDEYAIEDLLLLEEVNKLASLTEADFLVTGILIDFGGDQRYRIDIRVIDLQKGELLYSDTLRASEDQLNEIILNEIAEKARRTMLSYDLSGLVLDKEGSPVSGAEIKFSEGYSSVFTDEEGRWEKKDLFKRVRVEVEREGWEFNPMEKEVDFKSKDVKFRGREIPYLDKVDIQIKEDKLYDNQDYRVYARGYDQYGDRMEMEPTWEVWGGVGELSFPYGATAETITLKTTKVGKGTLRLKADDIVEDLRLEILKEPPYLYELKLESQNLTLIEGEYINFKVKAVDQYGETYPSDIHWSLKENIATLEILEGDENTLKALKEGEEVIKLKSMDLEVEVNLQILAKPKLAQIKLNPSIISIDENEKYEFEAKGFDQYGNRIDINPRWRIIEGPGGMKDDYGRKVTYQAQEWGDTYIEAIDNDIKGRAKIEVNMLKDWSLDSGISYNKYSLDKINRAVEDRGGSSINSGVGFYLGAKRWLNQVDFIEQAIPHLAGDMAVGIELERMSLSYDDIEVGEELSLSNTGVFLTFSYNLLDDILNMNIAKGQYFASETHLISGGEEKGRAYGPGFKVGLELSLPVITNKFNINGRGNYRFAKVGDYDFSGMEFSLLGELVF